MILRIKPITNPIFSRRPFSSPDYIASHSVWEIPPPTTVAGTLGDALGITIPTNESSKLLGLDKLSEKLNEKLTEPCGIPFSITGPLLETEGRYFVPIGEGVFLPVQYDNVKKIAVIGDRNKAKLIHGTERRVGVSLKRGYNQSEEKVGRSGMHYRYLVSVYEMFENEKKRPVLPNYVYKLTGCQGSGNIQQKRAIRFGGEGGIAFLEINRSKEEDSIFSAMFSPLSNLEQGCYLALSPIPLIPKHGNSSHISEVTGLEPFGGPSSVRGICDERSCKVKVVRMGLGFSEVYKSRRPQILALPQGTLLEVSDKHGSNNSKVLKVLYSLGFASLLKVGDELCQD
ncbi:MAG: hypothetical protein ACP5I2_07550 [Fervidicoccaceae archaeon]